MESSVETEQPHPSTPKGTQGRVPAEVRAQMLELGQQGLSLQQLAQQTGRSLSAVRKIIQPDQPDCEQVTDVSTDASLDQIVEFLAELPDEAMQEVLQLAQLSQQSRQLRNQLEARLRLAP